MQLVHGTTVVVKNGVVGTVDVAGLVIVGDELVEAGLVLELESAATGVLDDVVVTALLDKGDVAGTIVVTGVVVIVVFMLWLQLVVTIPLVVKVLQSVHGAVMVMVDIVVTVLTSVIVTGTADGVLVTVTTEPLLSVVVVVTGGGVELVTMAATGVLAEDDESVALVEDEEIEVLPGDEEADTELLVVELAGVEVALVELTVVELEGVGLAATATELGGVFRSTALAPAAVGCKLDVRLMIGPLELGAALLLDATLPGALLLSPQGAVIVLVTVAAPDATFVTVTVAVGEQT